MKKILITFFMLTSLAAIVYAQSSAKGKISGKVIDSLTGAPVEYATISIYKPGATSPFNGARTDSTGHFVITNLALNEYHLSIAFLGYYPKSRLNILVSNQTPEIILGDIFLVPVRRRLNEVTITARTPTIENKIDKLVYNAATDLTSQGGVALDILRKVPTVSVDIDGNVELQGNGNVRFLINGKPSSIFGASVADALQAIPASQIKTIEVITSPGAKYDAEGTAGIINIVLKDSKIEGISGSMSLSAGTRLENGSFNINGRKGEFGINAFFGGNDQLNSVTRTTNNRQSFNSTKDTITLLHETGINPLTRNGYQSGLSADWSLTPNDNFTATIGFNHTANNSTGYTLQNQQVMLSSGAILSTLMPTRVSVSNFFANSVDWSLAYKKTLSKKGQELDLLYTSTNGKNTTDASQVTQYPDGSYAASGLQSDNPGKDNETDISVDYTQPIGKGFTLETGIKAVLEKINDNSIADTLLANGLYVSNAGQTYNFSFQRNIYAAYVSTSFSLFKDFFNGQAGLRFERTITSSAFTGVNIPAENLVEPAFVLQHKFDETQSVKFAFSYRVELPEADDLDPFLNVADPNNISTGNPLLKTETGHKVEIGYNKTFANSGSIYAGGYYNYNDNDAQTLATFYPVYVVNGVNYYNVSVLKPVNIASQTTFGANIFGSYPVTGQLTIRSNISLRQQYNIIPGQATVAGFTFRGNLNAVYQFTNNMAAEIFGNYISRRTVYDGSRPSFFYYTAALRKQLLNKNLSAGLTATNPFNKYVNQLAKAYGDNFNQSILRQVPLRSFGVTLSYKFGNSKIKSTKEEPAPEEITPVN